MVDKAKRSVWFDGMEEIDDVFEVEFRKEKVTINRPFQIGIVVYQLAKLRMLQFYYDCLGYFIDRRDFELIQMDTDSMYLGLSCETLKEAIRPNRLDEFEATKKNWFAWDKWSNRTPGRFKMKFEGTRGIERRGRQSDKPGVLDGQRNHATICAKEAGSECLLR